MFVPAACASACFELALVGLRSAVFCCPHARGYLVFLVAFLSPGGSAELLCTCASPCTSVNFSLCQQCLVGTGTCVSVKGLPSHAFCCVPLCTCASAYFKLTLVYLCSRRSFVVHLHVEPSFFCSICVSWRVCELLCTRASASTYVHVPSCQRCFARHLHVSVHWSGVCVPLHFTVFVRAATPVHALS